MQMFRWIRASGWIRPHLNPPSSKGRRSRCDAIRAIGECCYASSSHVPPIWGQLFVLYASRYAAILKRISVVSVRRSAATGFLSGPVRSHRLAITQKIVASLCPELQRAEFEYVSSLAHPEYENAASQDSNQVSDTSPAQFRQHESHIPDDSIRILMGREPPGVTDLQLHYFRVTEYSKGRRGPVTVQFDGPDRRRPDMGVADRLPPNRAGARGGTDAPTCREVGSVSEIHLRTLVVQQWVTVDNIGVKDDGETHALHAGRRRRRRSPNARLPGVTRHGNPHLQGFARA